MLRISKLTDYGIVLLAYLARAEAGHSRNARELAAQTGLPQPAVSKILKALATAGLLTSQRGSKGGYALTRRPNDVNVADIIEALEGPIALMECIVPGHCEQEPSCPISAPWQRINRAVQNALRNVTLDELAGPAETTRMRTEGHSLGGVSHV